MQSNIPLAERLRPRTLDEYIGQEHLVGKNGVFRKQGLTIDAYFDRLFLSYEMGLVKPGAEIFRRMIESSGIVPSQTLFIDDSQANVDTGKACGFDTYLAARNEDFRPLFDRIEPLV